MYAESKEPFISLLGLEAMEFPFIGVCAGTGSTLQMDLVYNDFSIAKGTEVVVERVLRPCNHSGVFHANADDYLLFQDKRGNFIRVSRRDAPDHVETLSEKTGLTPLISAYSLPKEKSGFIKDYVANGALMPIRIDCFEEKGGVIVDLVKNKD